MPDTPITFDDVEVTRCTDLGMWCSINGREVFVGTSVPLIGTKIRQVGDIGRLVIPRWFVQGQELNEQ